MKGDREDGVLLTDDKKLVIWTIYWSPSDYPGEFVARAHVVGKGGEIDGTKYIKRGQTLQAIHEQLPAGLIRFPRHDGDFTINRGELDVTKIKIEDDGEDADFLVCVEATAPMHFPDNETGVCCHCGVKVQFRHYSPVKPKRICMRCFGKRERGADDSVVFTKRSLQEAALVLSKPKGKA